MRAAPLLVACLAAAAPRAAAQDPAANATNATGDDVVYQCKQPPAWGEPVGVIAGAFASVGINIGQNMQADGIRKLPEHQREKEQWRSPLWRWGMGVFVSCSIVNFAALALAPASVLVPLESIQFVTNVCYAKLVHKSKISFRMVLGVFLAVVGTVLSVVFGATGGSCKSLEDLEWAWKSSPAWWTFVGVSVTVALVCLRINRDYSNRVKMGQRAPGHQIVGPITFTLSSALLGGSQMIVQSKVFSELLAMIFQGFTSPLTGWLLYVAVVLVVACGMLWVIRLTQCLGLYNPILILPLMVATYILFGGVAGGIYFREFDTLHVGRLGYWNWALYIAGMLCVLVGLYFIAVAGIALEEAKKKAMPKQRNQSRTGKQLWVKAKAAVKLAQLYEVSEAQATTLPQAAIASHPAILMASATATASRRLSESIMSRVSSRNTMATERDTYASSVDALNSSAGGDSFRSTGSGSHRARNRTGSATGNGGCALTPLEEANSIDERGERESTASVAADDERPSQIGGAAGSTDSLASGAPPREIRSETPPSDRPPPKTKAVTLSPDAIGITIANAPAASAPPRPPVTFDDDEGVAAATAD